MKTAWWYRASSLLLVLFAVGHTLGFRKTDVWPDKVKPVVAGMQTVYFPADGFLRSYWDFYVGFGLFVTVMMLFAGSPTARVLAVFFVTINAIAQIVWFPLAPLWAFLIILLDVTIIYQLTARWDE